MVEIPLPTLKAIARQLNELGVSWTFTGGSIIGLLMDEPALGTTRPTGDVEVRAISPPCFLATKHEAFLDRGKGDYFASHDLEDFITVIDARKAIVDEVKAAQPTVCAYLQSAVKKLLKSETFMEALPGHLPFDWASQQRLTGILEKLNDLAANED